jgi:hypothetical protein
MSTKNIKIWRPVDFCDKKQQQQQQQQKTNIDVSET